MKRWRSLLVAAGCLFGLALIVVLGSVALIESEEVVVIHTRDASGEKYSARIWIVDYEGHPWVAPGNRSNAWFQRLLADPRVEIERDGGRSCYRAVIVESPASLPALEQFLDKYASVLRATGLLNRILEPAGDETPPVAVRLEPIQGECAAG
jgi:hypothetical protein